MSAYDSNYFKNKKSDLDLSVYFIENLIHGFLEWNIENGYSIRKHFQLKLDIFSPHSYNKL